jgi:hypothetical protein
MKTRATIGTVIAVGNHHDQLVDADQQEKRGNKAELHPFEWNAQKL